jgi:hypothetical protein
MLFVGRKRPIRYCNDFPASAIFSAPCESRFIVTQRELVLILCALGKNPAASFNRVQ